MTAVSSIAVSSLRPPIRRRDFASVIAGGIVMSTLLVGFGLSIAAESARSDVELTSVSSVVRGAPRVVLAHAEASLHDPAGRDVAWWLFAAFAVAGIGSLIVFLRLARARTVAEEMARIDPLTRLPNRPAADEHIRRVAASAARHGTTYGVLLVDVDRFKSINDTYGHGQFDDVLVDIGRTLAEAARRSDFVGRWGGDEFLIVVTDVDRDHLVAAAERFRTCVGAVRQDPNGGRVATVSIGGAVGRSEDATPTVATADAALYTAKAAGRNCVVIAEDRHRRDEFAVNGGAANA